MSLIHQIALTMIPGVGNVTSRHLLSAFGSAEAIFNARKASLLQVDGVGKATADQILHSDALQRAESQMMMLQRQHVTSLFFTDPAFPQRLKNCFDAPILLYFKGNADLNHQRIVSVVGTRKITPYGRLICEQLAEVLIPYNVLLVSGLAYGVDISAHRESLKYNIPTVAVLAHGLDRIYPPVHRETATQMLDHGGLLTEFPFHTQPDKENFPKRNRIIAGISDVTIVVEAALKGGALITAEIANSYNRDVYAFPGKTTDEFSQGCNFLIKTNRAGLLCQPKDLIYHMGWELPKAVKQTTQTALPLDLALQERELLAFLENGPLRIDELAARAEIAQSKLAVTLLNLEIRGLINALPGSIYRRSN